MLTYFDTFSFCKAPSVERCKQSRWKTAIAVATVITAFFVSGCGDDEPTKPEVGPFPTGAVVYENRAEHLGSPPDIYISPMSEDRERKSWSFNLTDDPANDIYPVFSPDGTKVYFSSDRNGDYDLFEMDITEVTVPVLRQLTDFEGDETNATVHPNGTDLFFIGDSPFNLTADIFRLNIATGDTTTVYDDIGKNDALRYIPQQGNFFVVQAQKMVVLDTQTNTSSPYRNGAGQFGHPAAACDISKDGLTGYASIMTRWSPTSGDVSHDIVTFPFEGQAQQPDLVRQSRHYSEEDWFRNIRDIDRGHFLYTENSPQTIAISRIKVRNPGESVITDESLTTQAEGNNENSDYTPRVVFPPPN